MIVKSLSTAVDCNTVLYKIDQNIATMLKLYILMMILTLNWWFKCWYHNIMCILYRINDQLSIAISMSIIITSTNEEDVLFNIINNNDNIYNNKLYH